MLRTAAKKVIWAGRATSTLLGLAVLLAVLFGVATTALGATGGNFILGKGNSAGATTKLTSAAGTTLQLINNGTAAAATALNLTVPSGKAPLRVNATAGKATNLNADKVDGFEGASFVQGGGTASQGKEAIPAGDNRTVLTTSNPNIQVRYICAMNTSEAGSLYISSPGATEDLNILIDSSTFSSIQHFVISPNGSGAVSFLAYPDGSHTTIQAQGTNEATIEVFSFHRTNDCHVQAQALVTR
jgi:hypothetical protein